jgi:hypothetical protein
VFGTLGFLFAPQVMPSMHSALLSSRTPTALSTVSVACKSDLPLLRNPVSSSTIACQPAPPGVQVLTTRGTFMPLLRRSQRRCWATTRS